MYISEVKIKNYKSFSNDPFSIYLNSSLNILVGLNEAGKTTILEAIHLACSGLINGKPIKNELSQNLFNFGTIKNYTDNINARTPIDLPEIIIEIFFNECEDEYYKGDNNSYEDGNLFGFTFKISYNECYQELYESFVKNSQEVNSLPIEYFDVSWTTFARKSFIPRDLQFKSSFIDSSQVKTMSGCDVHFTKILRDCLSSEDKVKISQSHRRLIDDFRNDEVVKALNNKITEQSKISNKKISISVELQTKNAWENSLTTLMDDIPYSLVGMGEQSIVKTNLALLSDKTKKSSIILIEEPENHLTYTKLNELIFTINENNKDKQIIITTHNSFVANKLGLKSLRLLNNKSIISLGELKPETYEFFEKIAGHDTLRFILSSRIILVEGDSDELVVQKAYKDKYNKLPIEDGIDVMSVGLSFLRYLEIAEKLNKKVSVVTDNDGDIDSIEKKYSNYLGLNKKSNIYINYDKNIDQPYFELEEDEKYFNFNTLESKIYKSNSIEILNKVFLTNYTDVKTLLKFMKNNKTDCALKIFKYDEVINFPPYILKAVEDIHNA